MTSIVLTRRWARTRRAVGARAAAPPLSPRLQLARVVLVLVFVLATSLLLQIVIVSSLQQRATQQRAFDAFRADLAEGTAPVGGTDADGNPLAPGTPVAYLEVPSIGLRQVVMEGTAGRVLMDGPGHLRGTPLPGQAGASVVFGRRAGFGGPFSRLEDLRKGARIRVTTGQGEFDYEVTGLRRDGDRLPASLDSGPGRLLLATADGRPFLPSGVLRVDAALADEPVAGRPATGPLARAEQMMKGDTSTVWALVLWLQALVGLLVVAIWAWHRWGRAKAWVVFVSPVLLVSLGVAGEASLLLPNLL